jgi:iron complex outermembrane recepter protein
MIFNRMPLPALILAVSAAYAASASGQRTDENPVTAARDAFGTSIGGESIGLYQAGNVRGFSPLAAGNVRLEGLYYDRQAEFTGRLVAGHSIRVGVSSLGYAFPSPTGIVDYRLRLPGDARMMSVVTQINSFGGRQVEVDAQLPLQGERFGVHAGGGVYGNEYPDGGDATVTSAAITARVRPAAGIELLPFWSRIDVHDRKVSPVLMVDGAHLPPALERRRFLGQRWAALDAVRTNYGAVATGQRGSWRLRGGAFRSIEQPSRSHSLLLMNADADGEANLVAIASPGQRFASSSGEVRLSREFAEGPRLHTVHVTARGRVQQRRYGGSARSDLGRILLGEVMPLPRPEFAFGAQSTDEIRHGSAGVSYEGRWRGFVELNAGLQAADYRKTVRRPSVAAQLSRDEPLLYNAALAVQVQRSLALYGGIARGLEESPVAPETAVNRDEAPPAIRTRQHDAGVRWEPAASVRIVAGVFRVEKPYHALDSLRVFRRLGAVRHQGVEVSVSGEPLPGLTVVAGAVPIDATVRGEVVDGGFVGARPVGSTSRSVIVTIDYRPAALRALSIDLAVEHAGERVANVANTMRVPAATNLDVGARFRFLLRDARGVVRLSITNAFDSYDWNVLGSGAFTYSTSRQVVARVAFDL